MESFLYICEFIYYPRSSTQTENSAISCEMYCRHLEDLRANQASRKQSASCAGKDSDVGMGRCQE
jgi:hypothetical protein